MNGTPDPEICANLLTDFDELPASARRLVARIGPGWSRSIMLSRGPVITSRGWSGRIADCLTITLTDQSGGAALACFLDGKYSGGYTWVWCTDCTESGFAHALNTPVEMGYRDLCILVSAT